MSLALLVAHPEEPEGYRPPPKTGAYTVAVVGAVGMFSTAVAVTDAVAANAVGACYEGMAGAALFYEAYTTSFVRVTDHMSLVLASIGIGVAGLERLTATLSGEHRPGQLLYAGIELILSAAILKRYHFERKSVQTSGLSI